MTRLIKITLIGVPAVVAVTAGAVGAMLLGPPGLLEVLRVIATTAAQTPGPVAEQTPATSREPRPVGDLAAAPDDQEIVSLAVAHAAVPAAEPAPAEPVAAEPAPAQPVAVEPASAEPVAVGPPAAEPAQVDPVNYSKLNRDVKEVADTLERFNQKLLRMIAQARASQKRQEQADTPMAGTPGEAIAQ